MRARGVERTGCLRMARDRVSSAGRRMASGGSRDWAREIPLRVPAVWYPFACCDARGAAALRPPADLFDEAVVGQLHPRRVHRRREALQRMERADVDRGVD